VTTLPELRGLLDQLARLGRVVVFDKRGTGLSDRVRELPDLDARSDDLRAVLDAVGSERAVLLGISEGGPLSIAFAALYWIAWPDCCWSARSRAWPVHQTTTHRPRLTVD
jgi:pimeloyl-ACP methyl ester carboxylesterase